MENKKRRMSSFSPPHSIHMILSLNPIHLITNITNRIQGQKKKREREQTIYYRGMHLFISSSCHSPPPHVIVCIRYVSDLIRFAL